ncbi:MAG: hypothetical protein R8G01_03840 [Ilumatobacteraceae bacterium]|nr:hypothetical protein [Ilumatobacteraceae bacterium]
MSDPLPTTDDPPRRVRWALRAAVVLPIAVAAIRALLTGWFPVGDSALLAIRAADVGTSQHPWLGSWTSASLTLGVDVNNPGPLYPDLLAPFMWTIGRIAGIGPAIAVGVASINAAFALAIGWVGRRLGGWRVERWTLVMAAALTWSMGSELLIDIWQPHALLLPFVCLLLLTVGLVDRCWSLAPAWLGVASLVVQTHIGYVYVTVVLGLLVGAVGVVAWRSSDTPPLEVFRHRITFTGGAVLALAWVQPLIEQVAGAGRGNLARLASNAGGGDVTIGAATAVKLVARVVALPPWWSRPGFEDSVRSTPLTDTIDGPRLFVPGLPAGPVAVFAVGVLLAVLAALVRLTRERRLSTVAAAALVALVGVATAVVTLGVQTVSVVGLGSHHVRWLWALSLFVQFVVVWAAVELWGTGLAARTVDTGVGVVVGLFVVANLGVTAHALGPTADRAAADTLERTFEDLEAFDPGGAVLYDMAGVRPFEPWSSAVQMRLRELGIDFRVADEGMVRQLGNGRRADGTEVTTIRQIERSAALVDDELGCVISRASPFDAATEYAIDAVIDAAVSDLAAGRVELDLAGWDPDLAARFDRATSGDTDEAFVLVADGVVTAAAADDRILETTSAIDALVAQADRVGRRVDGTLVLIADPPIGC